MTSARALPAALAAVALFAVAGCTADVQTPPGAPPSTPELIQSPLDGWTATVYTFCDHGHRVYQTALGQGAGVAVVPADPSSAGGAS